VISVAIDEANLRIQGGQRYEEIILPQKLKEQKDRIKSFIISELKNKNPYPSDIFIEPSKEDWKLLNSICRINGKNSEAFMGSFGRLVWNNWIEEELVRLKDYANPKLVLWFDEEGDVVKRGMFPFDYKPEQLEE